jgi:hypothetical protein
MIDVEMLARRLAEVERKVAELESADKSPPPKGSQSGAAKISPREFLLDREPKTDNDKTLTAAFYIEQLSGAESFDFDDIERFLGQAKEPMPRNRRDPPYQNVKKGYFREVGEREQGMHARNRWALTNKGIQRVESKFVEK